MYELQKKILFKLVLGITFFLGLNLVNLSLAQLVLAAGKSADEIYIQPIKNLDIGLFGVSSKDIIKAIIPDNYQVYCANPTAQVSPEVLGDYERFLELSGGSEVRMDTDLEAQLNQLGIDRVVDISNPLTVDDSGGYSNIDQVTFQGNHEVPMIQLQVNPFQANVITADYYKRLSLSQQCAYQKKAQQQIAFLCSKKDVPKDQCPLNITLPNTSIKALDLEIPDCQEIEKPEVIKSLSTETLNGIANTPLPQLNSKRLAFLMRCIEQRPSSGERLFDKSFLNTILGWLGLEMKQGDECHVLTIAVDSPTTEQELENDPIEFHNLSRQILTPYADWEEEKRIYQSQKSQRLENAMTANARGYSDAERINCVNCKKGDDREIKDALASYVNSINPSCEGIVYEESETISSQASITSGGGNYNASGADAFKAFSGEGILSTLWSRFQALIMMGSKTQDEIESRKARVETFIITPHDNQTTINQFLTPQTELEHFAKIAEDKWPTHVKFNETPSKEAIDQSKSSPDSHQFYDPAKCRFDQYGVEIPGSCTNSFGVKISTYSERPGNIYAPKYRGDNQTQASLFAQSNPVHNYIIETLYTNPDTETFLKGNQDGKNKEGEKLLCSEIKSRTTQLPTMNELMKLTCSIAGNDPNDAQLLWGFLQIEASPMLRKIRAGASSMSCGEIVTNSCGGSGIVGVLIPQCIDKAACPQAAYIADDTTDPWIQESRENPNIACDIKTSMEYVLRKRKSEKSWLTEQYKVASGTAPSTKQLYYMMAGRNYGVPLSNLVQPACGNYEPVQGCGGANYCVCTMDTFTLNCGNIR
ncbi:hypothetical protein KJ707_01010 [Patescibacteria group bacterium]|nr:hypothetical protein [Patescibacteria group bacterium]